MNFCFYSKYNGKSTIEQLRRVTFLFPPRHFILSINIDIESCVEDEYDWSPRGEIHKESAWANSGGKDGYALFWNVIEIDDRAFQNK